MAVSPNSLSILLVGNDQDSSYQLEKNLIEDLNFPAEIDHAECIQAAISKVQSRSYHLLLVESEIQGEDGLDLLEEVRQLHVDIPFVLLMPVRDDRLVRAAMKLGVADFIIKSEGQFEVLSKRLRDSYEKYQRQKSSPEAKTCGDLEPPVAFPSGTPVKKSILDELTGLYNHSYFHDRVVREFSRSTRYHHPLSCLLIDIDQFKQINEDKGYRSGDELLQAMAKLLFEHCRLSDYIARYGGEEFAILLPHIDSAGTVELASRLRRVIAENKFVVENEEISLTVSIGISSFPEDGMKIRSDMLAFAREALLRSKILGRNRITRYKDVLPVFGDVLPELKISEDQVLEFQRRLSEISNMARRAYLESSRAMILALENKDAFTAGHAASCAKYSMQVAAAMGLEGSEAEIVEHAALLHDIGKICIPDHVLLKTGKLTFSEFEDMKQHPYLGYKILKPIKFLQQEAVLVLHHHEWFNGEGYPCHLKGNEIPLGARIISVIDAYDTVRGAGGRYKKTMTVEDAVNELIACSGAQFDPNVVRAFIDVLKQRGELTTENYQKDRLEKALQACK